MIELKNVNFSYGEESAQTECKSSKNGIHKINLNITDGEMIVLCGASGCGKTTLTRLLNGLIPHYYEGKLKGEILVNGEEISQKPLYKTSQTTGSVFQNPRSQFFNVDTTSEITFGCENLGVNEEEIKRRLKEVTDQFELADLLDRNIFHLSGGQKQKIACAGVSIMHPDIFVLDEPSSNLDTTSIEMLRKILKFWKEQGKTIIISEHRLYYLAGLADRYIYMEDGKIKLDETASVFKKHSKEWFDDKGLRRLEEKYHRFETPENKSTSEKESMILKDFSFSYVKNQPVLSINEMRLPLHEIIAITGRNGIGKSTFARCICGLEKSEGTILIHGRKKKHRELLKECYMVMQDVNHQLFTESVLDEVMICMKEENEKAAERILTKLDLLPLKDRHPMSLSGGQKQRLAVASAIASGREILFFDEPTSGLDLYHMKEVADILKFLKEEGKSVFVITHDSELIEECCTNVYQF